MRIIHFISVFDWSMFRNTLYQFLVVNLGKKHSGYTSTNISMTFWTIREIVLDIILRYYIYLYIILTRNEVALMIKSKVSIMSSCPFCTTYLRYNMKARSCLMTWCSDLHMKIFTISLAVCYSRYCVWETLWSSDLFRLEKHVQ